MIQGAHPLAGGLCALASAATWAVAALIFARLGTRASPFALNLGKGLVGLGVLGIGLAFVGFGTLPLSGWVILGLSGLIGIGFGDTVYFAALVRLGPRKMLVVTTLIPIVASVMAMVFLGERPSLGWAVGATVCLSGVAWVMWERLPTATAQERSAQRSGLWLGIVTIFLEALGILLSKVGMEQGGDAGFAEATFVRLLAGATGVLIYGVASRALGSWVRSWVQPGFLVRLVWASLLGTVLGIGLAMAALWLTDVHLASVLNSTTPLFILPLAVLVLGERLSLRTVLGTAVAVSGVAVLILTS